MPDDIARAEERCMERLKSKKQVLETAYDFDTARLEEKCERLQKQLDIAVKALRGVRVWANTGNGGEQAVKKLCDKTLKEIEELNNG
jgi:hypothetical protein